MEKQRSDAKSDEKVTVIAERKSPVSERVSRLVRVDGQLMCECPYACLATTEPCDYEEELSLEREKIARQEDSPWKKFAMKFRLK